MSIQEENQKKREFIISEIKRIRPDAEFEVGKWSTDLVYYIPSVIKGKIKIKRNTRSIVLGQDLSAIAQKMANNFYRTEAEAKIAIEKVMPKAIEKFKKCLLAYNELTKSLEFDFGFNYDGDTHGIYNEYHYISFKMEGFDFEFLVED